MKGERTKNLLFINPHEREKMPSTSLIKKPYVVRCFTWLGSLFNVEWKNNFLYGPLSITRNNEAPSFYCVGVQAVAFNCLIAEVKIIAKLSLPLTMLKPSSLWDHCRRTQNAHKPRWIPYRTGMWTTKRSLAYFCLSLLFRKLNVSVHFTSNNNISSRWGEEERKRRIETAKLV